MTSDIGVMIGAVLIVAVLIAATAWNIYRAVLELSRTTRKIVNLRKYESKSAPRDLRVNERVIWIDGRIYYVERVYSAERAYLRDGKKAGDYQLLVDIADLRCADR